MSLRGRKNLPVGSSISSWAGAPAILDDTASAPRIDALNARSLAEEPVVRFYARRHRCPRPGSIEFNELIPKPEVFFHGLRSVYVFLPLAHRGARVIGTDAMRILLISQELSDGQERTQDNKDNPNINAHQSTPPAPLMAAPFSIESASNNLWKASPGK
jgi:hypothetical protein